MGTLWQKFIFQMPQVLVQTFKISAAAHFNERTLQYLR